jgi:hypothetical protein
MDNKAIQDAARKELMRRAARQEIARRRGQSSPMGMDSEISGMLPEAKVSRVARQFEALPGWAKPLVAADDLVTQFASGLGMGLPEKGVANLKAWWNESDYKTERAKIDSMLADSRERSGIPGMIANIGGAVSGPAALAKAGVTATAIPKLGRPLGLAADGAAIGAVTAYGNDQDVGTGALIGGGLGAAGQAIAAGGAKVVSPFLAPATRSKAATVLAKEGVPITAGQKTGSRGLMYAESELGGGAAGKVLDEQADKFTAAALKRVGETADRATPEVMDKAFRRIGKNFDDLSMRNALIPDQRIAADLTQIAVDYASLVAPSARLGKIEKTVTEVLGLLRTGRMDGKVYKTLRSDLDRFARSSTQPEAKMAVRDLIQALDAGMERSILKLNPGDAGAWSKARREYRNILVIEEAVSRAGDKAASGVVTPANLRSATARKQGKRNYVRGSGDFARLARAGAEVMPSMPESGTSSRLAARGVPALLGAGIGAGMGVSSGDVGDIATNAAIGAAVPYVAGRALMSAPMQKWLGNQAAAPMTPELQEALARLIAAGGTPLLLGSQ